MPDQTICIGPMAAIVAAPDGTDPAGAIIMFPHVGGLTDTMRTMARRAAQGGLLCVVPDLYHRLGTIVIDPQSSDERVVAIRRIAAGSLTAAGVMEDTRAVLDWLNANPLARRGARGTVGYGAGGGFAVLAACTYPAEIKAAASVLGFGFDTAALPALQGELYAAFAENDDKIPAEVPAGLAAALKALPISAELVVHPGTRHPYAFPDRTVYDRDAAERDWQHLFGMLARQQER